MPARTPFRKPRRLARSGRARDADGLGTGVLGRAGVGRRRGYVLGADAGQRESAIVGALSGDSFEEPEPPPHRKPRTPKR